MRRPHRLHALVLGVLLALAACGSVDPGTARRQLNASRISTGRSAKAFGDKLAAQLGGRPTVTFPGYELCSGDPEPGVSASVDVTFVANAVVTPAELRAAVERAGGSVQATDPPAQGIMPVTLYIAYPHGEAGLSVQRRRVSLQTGGSCVRVTDEQVDDYLLRTGS